jgi:argininosuccinate lyase
MKLWGGRFETGPDETFDRFSRSLQFDKRLLEADIRGSQAFARALESVGILTSEERQTLVSSFDEIWQDSHSQPDFFGDLSEEDVHTLVIRKLGEKTALAGKIHTGRSRNEQVSLDTRWFLRGQIDITLDRLYRLMEALLNLADKYSTAVIPGYTHLKRAQPVLWPHYLLAYFEMFSRDVERLQQARGRVNLLPLGSGALAGSAFPFDREKIAADLEFGGITRNSMDVSGDRDWALDYIFSASMVMLHLSRLAEDWILYSSDEFGWIVLGDGVTSGSSLMPQKKNPDSLELIRGKAGRVYGSLTSLFITMKGLPMTYNRDMQEDKEPIFEACDQTVGCLEMAAVVADSVVLKPQVPAAQAAEGWLVATDLAEELARRGVAFHESHKLVGRIVLEGVKSGRKPTEFSAADLESFAPGHGEALVKFLQPEVGMSTRNIAGGTGPEVVRAALSEARKRWNELAQ